MSAMSVEKPNDKDYRFKQVVRAVNYPCVEEITTRDGKKDLIVSVSIISNGTVLNLTL